MNVSAKARPLVGSSLSSPQTEPIPTNSHDLTGLVPYTVNDVNTLAVSTPTAGALAGCPSSGTAAGEATTPAAFKRDTASLVEVFLKEADSTLREGDSAAVFNFAADFAERGGLSAGEMLQVLRRLRQRAWVSARLVRSWLVDGPAALGQEPQPALADAAINEGLQAHTAETSWQHSEAARELASWFGTFNAVFFSGILPAAAISLERTRRRNLGWYRYGRDGLALRHRININSLYLDRGRRGLLETLLHEMIHEYEEVVLGKHEASRHHSKAFRSKAEELGVPTHKHGYSLPVPVDGRFARLMARSGIPLSEPGEATARPRATVASRSRLAKWRCRCTSVWASSRVEVEGVCRKCGMVWVRAS